MYWRIDTKDTSIDLGAFDVLNLLMGKVVDKERPDQEALAGTFVEYLQTNKALSDISLTQLVSMAFELGYFYRVFRTQNEVTITEVTGEASDHSSESTPTS